MFWRRDWELIDKHELPSGIEQLQKAGELFRLKNAEQSIARKAVVLTFKCKLTGRIKVVKESNP